MVSFIERPGVLQALYAGNALWHTSAFFHFVFRPEHTMRRVSLRKSSTNPTISALPSGDKWHHDVLAYLGGMNTPLALLALLRLYALVRPSRFLSTGSTKTDVPLDVLALVVLGLANCSQAFLNFTLGRANDRWILGKGLDRITVLDAVFTVLDWSAAAAKVIGSA